MQKLEARVTPRINKWFEIICPTSSPWEVKHSRGKDRFSFKEIKPHQINYLTAATTPKGFTYKIPDIGLSHPPCDVIHYKNTPAYVIIMFNTYTVALEIRDVNTYMFFHKSITEQDAFELATFKIENKKLPK